MTHRTSLLHSSNLHYHLPLFPHFLCLPSNDIKWNYKRLQKYLGIGPNPYSKSRLVSMEKRYIPSILHAFVVEKGCGTSDDMHVNVQTLRKFPVEKLYGEHAIVRIDSCLLLEQSHINSSASSAISTIRYLHNAGAKILLLSNWGEHEDSIRVSTKYFSDSLSKLLGIEVRPANTEYGFMQLKATDFKTSDILLFDNLGIIKEEFTNCSDFSEKISSGAYIFVNDAFILSRKVLASTVGISRFCDVSVAGFHFEEQLLHLAKLKETTRKPYIAIIGGSKFFEKADALHLLASKCDGLIFVGKMAFLIMHALGVSVPSCLVEHESFGKALRLAQIAKNRNTPMYYPDDFWCVKNSDSTIVKVFPSDEIVEGWTPMDLGPMSLKRVSSLLSNCKKALWIGPMKFNPSVQATDGESKLLLMFEKIKSTGCEIVVVGNSACERIVKCSDPLSPKMTMYRSASIVWEFLKGRILPGVAALDRVYPFDLDWYNIFENPTQPLIVDIGSGNGLFLLNMAKNWNHSNFLGLEINDKLVKRCQRIILESDVKNVNFISTNASSSFRLILSHYPGELVLVSIQCPIPDFNREEHRWRMVRRILVEDIVDLLILNGKIFLQSDIEDVALRMKKQFIEYGKEKLTLEGGDEEGWLPDNPFGIRSDWEQHVVDRGGAMYRLMFKKVGNNNSQ